MSDFYEKQARLGQKRVFLNVLLIAIFLSLTWSPANADSKRLDLRVCMIDTNLFPLWRKPGEERMPVPGINIELMNHVAQPLDIKIIWIRQPFARCLHSLQLGSVDALNVASYSKEREVYGVYPQTEQGIDVSRRFKYDTYYAYTRHSSPTTFDGLNFSHLEGLPVAVEIGASVISTLTSHGLNLQEQSRVEFAFKMLRRGRVAAVVTNQYSGLKYMSHDIKQQKEPVQEKPYYLMFSHQYYSRNAHLVEQIWSQSGQLQEKRYQEILEKYAMLSNWPGQ